MFNRIFSIQAGQTIVDLLIVIGLAAILIPAIFSSIIASRSGKAQQIIRLDAVALLKETQEAVRSAREASWQNIAANGTYHPVLVGSAWSLIVGIDNVNGFSRSVDIGDVMRSSTGAIVQSGGTVDPSTKKVDIAISWTTPYVSSVSSTLYFSRFVNGSFTQTTQAEFNAGTKNGVNVTNTSGGEVILGAGGGGDWCSPNLSISGLDLPKSGVANAIAAREGVAVVGTGENSSGVSFARVNISNTDPPVATIDSTFNGYKTNDVFVEGNYGYIATDTNSKEIVILDISSVPYTEVGYFDAPGVTDANSVFVIGNTGYMTQGSRIRNFDLSSKTGSRPAIDSDGAAISATGTSVVVSGSYAFVSIAGHARELEIFSLSTPSNITRTGWADVNGEAATDVFINSSATRAYIVTNASATLPEFFIINVTNKNCSDCPDIGTYNAGTSVNLKAVEVVPGNRAIVIGQGGEEYQVIDISNEVLPTRCGGMQVDSGINDAASIIETDGDAYSYILTRDANNEFRIIEGGPGGQFSTSGTLESSTIDTATLSPPASFSAAFNRILANINKPSQTDIKLQAAASDAVSGSCSGASFSFLGPDGTATTYYTATNSSTIEAPILFGTYGSYKNPSRCFRYKAFLSTTDFTQSPTLFDVNVNYSP